MSNLDKIKECNRWNPDDYLPFVCEGRRLGSLRHRFAAELARWPDLFAIRDHRVDWIGAPDDFSGRTEALDAVVTALIDAGVITHRHGERYPLTPAGRDAAICLIDRTAAPHFGARAFGQHLNGYVREADGLKLWVARRSADRRNYPLRLDNLVGGGLPHGLSFAENLRKECREEADIPASLADQAVAVGAVIYCRESKQGLKPDVMYCYDLELPAGFAPRCTDGEVDSFELLPLDEVARLVRETDEFKLNCNLVIIDFLIRHGQIPEDDPDYLAILEGLRSPLPSSVPGTL